MPQNTYILVIDGKPQGPFSIEQLKEFKIKPGDFLRTGDMDDYKEAHEIAELRELLGFSKQALPLQYFGSFDQRLMAAALDWFIVSGAFLILAVILAVILRDRMIIITILAVTAIIIPIAKFIYQVIMESSAKQGTYGKQLLKIKVCNMQGNRLSLAHAAGRNFAKIFSVLPFFMGYLFSFFTKQQQCLHDMVAETLVMKDRLF